MKDGEHKKGHIPEEKCGDGVCVKKGEYSRRDESSHQICSCS